MKRTILILPLLLLTVMARAEAGLQVHYLTGSDKQYAVSLIGQITFADNVMYLYDKSKTELGHTAVADIDKIVFGEYVPSSVNDIEVRVAVYPNPTHDAMVIKGLSAGQTVRVYDLQGRLLSATQTQAESTLIDVSALQNGTYLLQIGAEVVKFIKE
jgi:hypothetical protein